MICLAPTHPLLTDASLEITSIEFQIGRTDRTKNQPSGKFKNKFILAHTAVTVNYHYIQGGQKLTPTSPLCFVHCSGDKKFVLYRLVS